MINQAPLFRNLFVSLLFLVSGIPKSSTRTLHGNFVPSERTLYGNFLPEQTGKCRLTLLSLNVKILFNSFVGYFPRPQRVEIIFSVKYFLFLPLPNPCGAAVL